VQVERRKERVRRAAGGRARGLATLAARATTRTPLLDLTLNVRRSLRPLDVVDPLERLPEVGLEWEDAAAAMKQNAQPAPAL
jgi:hypothetical protein